MQWGLSIAWFPLPDDGHRDRRQAALDEMRKVGITSVQDMTAAPALTRPSSSALQRLKCKRTSFTVRIRFYWPLATWPSLAGLACKSTSDPWLSIGAFKEFIDGFARLEHRQDVRAVSTSREYGICHAAEQAPGQRSPVTPPGSRRCPCMATRQRRDARHLRRSDQGERPARRRFRSSMPSISAQDYRRFASCR